MLIVLPRQSGAPMNRIPYVIDNIEGTLAEMLNKLLAAERQPQKEMILSEPSTWLTFCRAGKLTRGKSIG
jgi:hypothetical protein